VHTIQNRLADAGYDGWSLIVLGAMLVSLMLLAPEGLMVRFARRPLAVFVASGGTIALLALLGRWGEPVDWLALALAAAALVAFIPGRRPAIVPGRKAAGGLGESVDLGAAEPAGESAKGSPLLAAQGVAKDFGGVHALREVSMTVARGELVGLVGPNGSGKTTLVNLISGAYRPTAGSITLDGVEVVGLPPHRTAHLGIARTYQIPRPFASLTVRDNVALAIMFGREPRSLDESREEAGQYLALVGLGDLAEALPGQVNLHERQLLEMARAMATRPSLLLLDEALAGLNPAEIDNAVAVVRRIHASGVAIVLVEHVLRIVNQLATRLVVLDQGRPLAEGEPSDVMADPAVVTAYLGREGRAHGH
jgi:branched-chain amino acid transport system permease protein